MTIRTIIFLISLVSIITPLVAHGQDWFRVRDISETPIITKAKWAAQWLLAPKELDRVRNLYGYELNTTCRLLETAQESSGDVPPIPLNDVDIGIGALVVVSPQSEDAIALKLGEPDDRETVGTVSTLCQVARNQSTNQSSQLGDLAPQLERCRTDGIECYVATGLMVPLDDTNPVRRFWTESGIVERNVSQGWVRIDEGWKRNHLQRGNGEALSSNDAISPNSNVYVYRDNTTNEVIGVLPPRSRVRVLAQHGSENWASIIPSHTN